MILVRRGKNWRLERLNDLSVFSSFNKPIFFLFEHIVITMSWIKHFSIRNKRLKTTPRSTYSYSRWHYIKKLIFSTNRIIAGRGMQWELQRKYSFESLGMANTIVDLQKWHFGGTWVAQSVEHPTLDFSWGHDPRVIRLSPTSGSVLSVEPAWDSLCLPLLLPPLLVFSLSLSP